MPDCVRYSQPVAVPGIHNSVVFLELELEELDIASSSAAVDRSS